MVAKNQEDKSFTLDELCALAETPARTARYYIQMGLVDRPVGETRSARYFTRHLEQLLTIRNLTRSGVALERIREVLAGSPPPLPARPRGPGTVEVCSHLLVTDGVELVIEPGRAGLSPDQVRSLFREVMQAYSRISQEER